MWPMANANAITVQPIDSATPRMPAAPAGAAKE